MKAMILAAGIGSRLDPLTSGTPKPLVPIVNKPVMEHIIGLLASQGIDDITINLHYLQESIERYFGDGSSLGVSINYSRERELMGTAGGVRRVGARFDDTFVVIGGDDLTAIPIGEVVAFHRRNGAMATIALSEVEDTSGFGVVVTDEDGRIRSFQEKPSLREALSRKANTGIYVFEPDILKLIPENEFFDFGRQLFPNLLKARLPFYGMTADSYWCDVGTLQQYRDANYDVLSGRCSLSCGQADGVQVALSDAQRRDPCSIASDASIDPKAEVGPYAVIGAGCRIESGASVRSSILWPNCRIGAGALLEGCILGSGCVVGPGAVIGDMAVLGDNCIIAGGTTLPPGYRAAAGTEVR